MMLNPQDLILIAEVLKLIVQAHPDSVITKTFSTVTSDLSKLKAIIDTITTITSKT